MKSKFGQGYVLEIKMKEIQRGGNDSLYEFIRKVGDLSENMKISLLTHKIIALFI